VCYCEDIFVLFIFSLFLKRGSRGAHDARPGGIFLRSLQPGHLTLVANICRSGPYRAAGSVRASMHARTVLVQEFARARHAPSYM
jgi:hypothetical protein